ncbi:glycosyltransferase [Pseudarthrobacter oxydans]|uniref:glycosyltransferase n=1 Tax=Pseudarthrobacter oxydans TaxID=1671 RepID=UPI003816C288
MPAISNHDTPRTSVLYVGRFAPAKKVSLLIEGFAKAAERMPEMRLILVGGGEEESRLRELASHLGVASKVEFPGWIDDLDQLLPFYRRSFCSASPGFAGLGLTQSLGFGIPMLVADNEPHSPEIELDISGGVEYFASDSPDGLRDALLHKWDSRDILPDHDLSEYTRVRYSAEAMAAGLRDAFENRVPSISNRGAL